MTTSKKFKILKLFISENDRIDGTPLYIALVNRLKEAGLAGATVVRGIAGYAAGDQIHAAKPLQFADNLPVIIEVVDEEQQLIAALPLITPLVEKGLIIMEDIQIISYRHPACETGGDGPAACGLSDPQK